MSDKLIYGNGAVNKSWQQFSS